MNRNKFQNNQIYHFLRHKDYDQHFSISSGLLGFSHDEFSVTRLFNLIVTNTFHKNFF